MRAPPALVAIAWLGVVQPDYGGCSCGELADDARPLPMGDIACRADFDCDLDPCEVGRCLAGSCMFTAVTDRDGDGELPTRCGRDCDDANPAVGPGAVEVCNFVDDDCDGSSDEAAPPTDVVLDVSAAVSPTSVVLSATEGALVVRTDENEQQLYAQRVGPAGPVEAPFELGLFDAGILTGTPANNGLYLVVVYAIVPQYAVFRREGTRFTVLEGPATLTGGSSEVATGFDAIPFGSSLALALDTSARRVRVGLDGREVLIGPAPRVPTGIALATDGTHLAVLDPDEDVLVFLDAAGDFVGRQPVPTTARTRALASGAGVVYVATTDGTSSMLTAVTAAEGAGASVPLAGDGSPRLASVDELVAVATEASASLWLVTIVDPRTGEPVTGSVVLREGYDLSAVRAGGGFAVSAGRGEIGFIQACGAF